MFDTECWVDEMIEHFLGYKIASGDTHDLIDRIFASACSGKNGRGRCRWLACLNPHSYAVAKKDGHFRDALQSADWLIADGIGVVLASRLLGIPIKTRVTGFDVFEGMLSRMNTVGGMSVFFLGSTEETLKIIEEKIRNDYPHVRIAGTHSPPFSPRFTAADVDLMINCINAAKPDVLWIGMTAPKQEKWLLQYADRLEVTFAAAVGAVFDFYSGRITRSPHIFQKFGFEWLARWAQEPKRLAPRMLISAPIFVLDVIREKVFRVR